METHILVINAIFYAAFAVTFIFWFNAAIRDFKVLRRLNRPQRILARLIIIIIWPVLLVIAVGALVLLVLDCLWSNFTK